MAEPHSIRGQRVSTLTPEAIRDGVTSVLAPYRTELGGDAVIVIPDTHYPYHPSTGLVTHPAVVEAVVATVRAATTADVVIGCRSAPVVSTAATIRTLGYDRMADRLDVEILDLDKASEDEPSDGPRDSSIVASFPPPLADAAVIAVPTLRTDPDTGLALGMTTVARAFRPRATTVDEIWDFVTTNPPVVSLLDGSYTYLGEPRESRFFLAGADVIALDGVVARSVGQVPTYLDAKAVRDRRRVDSIEGLSLDAVTEELPTPSKAIYGRADHVFGAAYRLYARLAGDAIPPQFLR